MTRRSTPLVLIFALLSSQAWGALDFVEQPTALPNLLDGDIDWVDIDNDGDLDIFISGSVASGVSCITKVFENNGGIFSELQSILPDVCQGDGDWADFDHDGDVDLVYTGSDDLDRAVLFRNDSGTLTEMQELCLPGPGTIRWVEFFANAHPDIINATTNGICTMVFDGTNYVENFLDLDVINFGDIAAADVDGNGLDWIAYSGSNSQGNHFFEVVSQSGELSLNGIDFSAMAFGDLNDDGFQDMVTSGKLQGGDNVSQYWLHTEPGFTDFPLGHGVSSGDIALGDADNDGDLDVALFGEDSVREVGEIHVDSGVGFGFSHGIDLVRLTRSSVSWGDYDGDGDLDLLALGSDEFDQPQTKLFRNDSIISNTAPGVPPGLHSTQREHTVRIGWMDTTDLETADLALTFDLRAGTIAGGGDIRSPHALSDGTPLLPAMGTVASPNDYLLEIDATHITGGDLYWSVQAVDNGFARSGFAPEAHIFLPYLKERDLGPWRFPTFQWANVDTDDAPEILVSGGLDNTTSGYSVHCSLIQEDGSTTHLANGEGELELGDFDNDGDLDLIVAGFLSADQAQIDPYYYYENNDGNFSLAPAGLPASLGVGERTVDSGDFDNDGDLDLLFSTFGLYENVGGTFVFSGQIGPARDYARFGDFDHDGDLDVVTGETDLHRIYRNDGDLGFIDIQQLADPGTLKTGVWMDIDNDRDLDLVLSSSGGPTPGALFENLAGVFVLDAPNSAVFTRPFIWEPTVGDLDHDGDLDLIAGGGGLMCPPDPAAIYRNDAGMLTRLSQPLPSAIGASALADHDGDGDLDLLLGGVEGVRGSLPLVRNNDPIPNAAPTIPTNLAAFLNGDELFFTWSQSSDDHTPTSVISYNIRVGTTPGGQEIVSAMSDLGSGRRHLAAPGNAGPVSFRRLDVSAIGEPLLYWSVQSIDGAYSASSFATEDEVLLQPTAISSTAETTAFLGSNPNPFSGKTSISFRLPKRGPVEILLYDMRGRQIRRLVGETLDAGEHAVSWNGDDDRGQSVSAGNYFLRLRAGELELRRRLLFAP